MLKRIQIQHLTLGMYLHEFSGSWMDHLRRVRSQHLRQALQARLGPGRVAAPHGRVHQGPLRRAHLPGFVKSIGIYPVGSLVRLTSGRIGIMTEQSPTALTPPHRQGVLLHKVRPAHSARGGEPGRPGLQREDRGTRRPREVALSRPGRAVVRLLRQGLVAHACTDHHPDAQPRPGPGDHHRPRGPHTQAALRPGAAVCGESICQAKGTGRAHVPKENRRS